MRQSAVTAQKVHTHLMRGTIQRPSNGTRISLTNQTDRRDGNALIYDRDTKLPFNILARPHQVSRHTADFVIHPLGAFLRIPIGAIQQVDAEGNRADIEVLLLDHPHGLKDFAGFNHRRHPP